jgi:dihydroorotase
MPNLVPPIDTKQAVVEYKQRIIDSIPAQDNFKPFMTLFFKPYSKEFLEDVKDEISAIKLYPAGITTNSEGGVESIDTVTLAPTFNAMTELNIPLCVHGETNGFVMDRETEFMSVYEELAIAFPKLTIIMEHITTKAATELLVKYDNLHATITLHHLLITLDDVAGGMLQPHLFCKPIAKTPTDRDALLKIALEAHPRVMFGSDSAPHPQHAKENCGCAAGVFTSPIALQVLVQLFEENNKLENLQKFISDSACNIYNMEPSSKNITLEKEDFIVPNFYEKGVQKVVPMYNNKKLSWTIKC